MTARLRHERFIERFAVETGMDRAALRRGVRHYFEDFSAYGNEVYRLVESRVAHWTSFMEGGWFQRRVEIALDEAVAFDLVVDVGFSVPYAYTRRTLLGQARPRFMFIDKERSAADFYKAVVRMQGWEERRRRDLIVLSDIERLKNRRAIVSRVEKMRPKSILVMASELVEHLGRPLAFWDLARRLCAMSAASKVYVTLPVGKRIPSHSLEFRSAAGALRYVESHMVVERHWVLRPEPTDPHNVHLRACLAAIGRPI